MDSPLTVIAMLEGVFSIDALMVQ